MAWPFLLNVQIFIQLPIQPLDLSELYVCQIQQCKLYINFPQNYSSCNLSRVLKWQLCLSSFSGKESYIYSSKSYHICFQNIPGTPSLLSTSLRRSEWLLSASCSSLLSALIASVRVPVYFLCSTYRKPFALCQILSPSTQNPTMEFYLAQGKNRHST